MYERVKEKRFHEVGKVEWTLLNYPQGKNMIKLVVKKLNQHSTSFLD